MADFPSKLNVFPLHKDSSPQTIKCTALLRVLGKKRKVLDATWNGTPVVVKVLAASLKASFHAKKNWRGLQELSKRDIDAPKPLLFARDTESGWVIVTQKIQNAQNLRDIWENTTEKKEKIELLTLLTRHLARHHQKGILQKDIHLGNYILKEDKLFALDPDKMKFLQSPVNKPKAIDQLAHLNSILPNEYNHEIEKIFDEYARLRNWSLTKQDLTVLRKSLSTYRKIGTKNFLRKSLRTSRRFQKIRQKNRTGITGIAEKNFYEKTDYLKFVKNIDDLMKNGQIIKRGNTCFVSLVETGGLRIVIKRYNHKGLFHSIRHTIKKSRARRNWLNSHRLTLLNIPTPKPLAFIEILKAPIIFNSYFITQYVEGQKLSDILSDSSTDNKKKNQAIEEFKKIIAKLSKHHITHGDLKHSNIIITDTGPVLTDLDAMKAHKNSFTYRFAHRTDIKRLKKPQSQIE